MKFTIFTTAAVLLLQAVLLWLGVRFLGAGHGSGIFLTIALAPFGWLNGNWAWIGALLFWLAVVVAILLPNKAPHSLVSVLLFSHIIACVIAIALVASNRQEVTDLKVVIRLQPLQVAIFVLILGSLYKLVWEVAKENQEPNLKL